MDFDKHRGGNKQGWWKTKMDFDKCGKGIFLWRLEFFKIGKHDFTFIREMRVATEPQQKSRIINCTQYFHVTFPKVMNMQFYGKLVSLWPWCLHLL